MTEKERDRLLRIHTTQTGEQQYDTIHYHHYEATPYDALDTLFNQYVPANHTGLVDYGCGKGRILFYVHHYFQLPVTGIEMSARLYREALQNEMRYMRNSRKQIAPIRFVHDVAENYQIEPTDTLFFFFNPFSIEIFMHVLQHVLHSVNKHPRLVDIILYYPSEEYHYFLLCDTPFQLHQEIHISTSTNDPYDRYLIYRYQP